MKLTLKLTILLTGIFFLLTGCKKNEPIDNNNLAFVSSESKYWGDYYGNGNSIFDLYLYDNDIETSPSNNLNGIVLYFDINASPNSTIIPSGTYKAETNGNPFTFQRGEKVYNNDGTSYIQGSNFQIWENNKIVDNWLITSGNLIVAKNGNYTISGIITTGDNIAYEFTYTGTLNTTDVTPWPETLTKGELLFNGKTTGNSGEMNKFTIYLGANDVTFPDITGTGDAMVIELFSPVTANSNILNGTYVVKFNPNDINTIIDGYTDSNGNDGGTWYYTSESFPITDGDMIVNISGNNYNLDYEFYTQSGMQIKGIYNGTLTYKTASAGIKSVQRIASQNSVKRKLNAITRTHVSRSVSKDKNRTILSKTR